MPATPTLGHVLGWFADTFRFAWALLYWNYRKARFQSQRGRTPCPCQSPSDSGRAYETGCDACISWERPARFRRVCPLLVETKDGLRCSVDTPNVRPFWGITLKYYGGAVLGLYAVAVLSVFGFLRTIGYPVSIVHVGLPPLWHRVGEARGWFFVSRAQQAFAAGRTNEGLLYLQNAYDFDSSNYEVGLALAKSYQIGQPDRSDRMFERLLADHPDRRPATAQHWFRALIARGNFERVAELAAHEVLHDRPTANVWMRVLVFATRQIGDATVLRGLAESPAPAAVVWKTLLNTELLYQQGRREEALQLLRQSWPADSPAYTAVYRAETMADLGQPAEALDLLLQLKARQGVDDEAYLTVRLHCLALAQAEQTLRQEFQLYLLAPPLNQPRLKTMCAQLIRHPNAELFERVAAKVATESMPLNDETAGGWFSLLCTAGAVGDDAHLQALALRLRHASETPFSALQIVESFFRSSSGDKRATVFLPFLPVPLEVTYALIERYPGARPGGRPSEGTGGDAAGS